MKTKKREFLNVFYSKIFKFCIFFYSLFVLYFNNLKDIVKFKKLFFLSPCIRLIKVSCIVIFFCVCPPILFSQENLEVKKQEINFNLGMTKENIEKFPIKEHHSSLSFKCIFCHENQGDIPEKFKDPKTKSCLSCHKSYKFLAQRLEFMDLKKANPHNSVHDGSSLDCNECHMEHKKSINMCAECHEREVPTWMGATP